MLSTGARDVTIGRPGGRDLTTRSDDMITTLFGAWMVAGLFADGWAHLNQPGLESFFTPWHAALYSGFAMSAGWLAVIALRARHMGHSGRILLPPGYGLGAVGVVLFGVGGLGDMAWHTAFGVETAIDALLSPTHLVLLSGGVLLLSTAWRSTWARPLTGAPTLRHELPAIVSMTLVTAVAAFFLLYTSVFTSSAVTQPLTTIPEGAPGHEEAELPAAAGIAAYLVTTMLLVVPLLLAERRGRRPVGAVAILVGGVAALSAVIGGSPSAWASALAVTIAGVGLEIAVRPNAAWGRISEPARTVVFAASVPIALWPMQLVAVSVVDTVRWPVELWSGIVVLTAIAAGALGLLAAPVTAAEPALPGSNQVVR